jgi:tetratricopeptide (TPR) repeat protein
MNRAHQLDPLSPIISESLGLVQIAARMYDDALATCQKLVTENPAFAQAHSCFVFAYWGKGMYPKAVEEFKILGDLDGNPKDAEFASAVEQGFHSGGWKGALAKGIEVRLAQRKAGYWSAYDIATLYAGLGEKDSRTSLPARGRRSSQGPARTRESWHAPGRPQKCWRA